eukprot:Blabericola_migrator_1__6051@NODE_3050_length_2085_cov_33_621407_g1905_i0_p1_GENE_NODE_3050_length_2085_cov_33_621407_g1905_i0NODE_3050_length_2085_cov_33_621407_g1905_i0_p1_ORF_typecomplete_len371_score59_01_NODE_3050_length_2085_cov_33_621407_g1905_i09721991
MPDTQLTNEPGGVEGFTQNEEDIEVSRWIKQLFELPKLNTQEQVAQAFKQPNTLISWVANSSQAQAQVSIIYLTPQEYKAVKKMLSGVPDSTFGRLFRVPHRDALRAVFMQYLGISAIEAEMYWDRCKTVIGSAIIAKYNGSYATWLRFVSDKNHPILKSAPDEKSAPEGVAWMTLPGIDGKVPFNKAYTKMIPTCLDRWFYTKNMRLHPMEKRPMATEIDMREHRSALALIFALLKQWSLQTTRPANQDKDYFFPLESEVPFEGTKVKPSMPPKAQWDVSLEVAQTLNNVLQDPNTIRPIFTREFGVNFLSLAPHFEPTMYSNDDADVEVLERVLAGQ